jgi:predicted transcriptional regulator
MRKADPTARRFTEARPTKIPFLQKLMGKRSPREPLRPIPNNVPKEVVRELLASDVMTGKVVSIRSDDALSYVVRLYVDKNISGSPVLSRTGNLVGTLSETDIAQYVGAKDLIDAQANRLDALKETRVEELMKRNIVTVREHTPIHEINYLMNKHDIARVFVIDEKREVIGIVTRADMVKGIAREMLTRMVEKEREIEKTHVDTGVDQVLEAVDSKGMISVDQISKKFGIPSSKVEEWGEILEKHSLIDVIYPPVGKPVFKKKAKRA